MLFKGHPDGLKHLFATEAFERFCYYGMRAILMLYMTQYLFIELGKEEAVAVSGTIYGWFTGLVYLTPVMGGYIAAKWIGLKRSVIIGAILMAMGYFTMAIPNVSFFYVALGLAIIGNGFFKPNISTMVGELYDEEEGAEDKKDAKRISGFTIFYMGINLGAIFSPLICGTLGEKVGWHWGFIAAGVGMIIGLTIFIWGMKTTLRNVGNVPKKKEKVEKKALTKEEKHRIAVIFFLVFFTIFFWSAFEQAGSSLTLFAKESTNLNILGWEMPASWFQSVNPIFIVLLAPIFSSMWINLGKKGWNPSTLLKFVIGIVLAGVGFLVMVAAVAVYKAHGPVSILWLISVYLIHTIGELCLSPIGLALVTRLAPKHLVAFFMGIWFLSSFAANLFAGLFASLYEKIEMGEFFLIPVFTTFGAAFILLVLMRPIKKWMHGIK